MWKVTTVGTPDRWAAAECHRGQEVVHTLDMDEVVASLPDLPDERRRDVEISPPRPRAVASHGQSSLVLHGWQLAREVGGEHGEVETPRGHPPRHLMDVRLDPAQVRRVTGAHHGDANRAHSRLGMLGDQCRVTSLQRSRLILKRRRPQFMTMRRGRRCESAGGPGVARDGGACRLESGGADGVDGVVVEAVRAPVGVGEVPRSPDRSTAPAPPSRRRWSAHCSCAGSPRRRTWSTVWAPIVTTFDAANWTSSDGVSGRASGGGGARGPPLLRDGIENPVDLRHRKGEGGGDEPTGGPRPSLDEPSPMRTGPSLVGRQISRIPDGRDPQQRAQTIPPEPGACSPRTPLVTKTVMGIPLASAIGNALVRLSAYPSSKVTTTRGRARREGQLGQGRRLAVPSDLVEVGREIRRGHAESERVIVALRHPVVAENQSTRYAPLARPFASELRADPGSGSVLDAPSEMRQVPVRSVLSVCVHNARTTRMQGITTTAYCPNQHGSTRQ